MEYEFSIDKRREVTVQLARHLGHDKPLVPGENGIAEPRVFQMKLFLYNEHGGGRDGDAILVWDRAELSGKGGGIESIVTSIGVAACRDAAYRSTSECIYVLVFYSKEGTSRSRFHFKLPAGQEITQMAGAALSGALGNGARTEPLGVGDLLRYVQSKEERLDKKQEGFVDSLLRERDQLNAIKTEYTDRELRIREIELSAEDHDYERKKKRREEEEAAQMKKEAWGLVKEHGPKLMPYVLSAVKRISDGPRAGRPMRRHAPPQPGSPGQDPGFDAWYASQQGTATATPRSPAPGAWGSRPGPGSAGDSAGASDAWYGPEQGPEAASSPPAVESPGAPSGAPPQPVARPGAPGIEVLRARVAFDAARFVLLAKGRGQLDAIRGALSEEQRATFGRIEALSGGALDTDAEAEEMAGLALAFGLSVQADPASGVRLAMATEPMTKMALVELSNLLLAYQQALQAHAGG